MKKQSLLILFAISISLLVVISANAQPGSFSLTNPANGAYMGATPTFTWQASSGATSYQLWINGSLKKDNIVLTSYTLLPAEALIQGMFTWYIKALNTGGNTQSSETRSILVDTTPPNVFNLISPADNSWTTSLQPTLSWSASSDASSGLAKYQLWIDGILDRDNISTSETSTTPIFDLKNGKHTWEVKAVDVTGNVKSSNQLWTLNIDNLPPGTPNVSALSFDGIGLGVDLGNSNLFNLNDYVFTIESWVCFYSGGSGSPAILSKENGYSYYGDYSLYTLGTGTARKVCFASPYTVEITSTSSLSAGIFYHIAVTMNRNLATNQIKLYINGKLDSQKNVSSFKSSFSTAPLRFGRGASQYAPYYSDRFKGIIDEVRFWNFDKTEAQIQKEMNISLRGNESGLIGYWRLDEWDGYVVHDEKLANDGIIYGASYNHSFLPDVNFLCDQKYPINNKFISTTLPTLEWSSTKDAGIGFDKFQLFIDNNLVGDNIKDSIYIVKTSLKYGSHEWYLKGFDLLGNSIKSQKQIFSIDNAPPMKFDLIAPRLDSIVFLPTPNLSWQATTDSVGGSGISKYQLWINGVKDRDSISGSLTTVAPSNALAQGTYIWEVKAYDKVGNIQKSNQTGRFYVDWEPPTAFTLINPVDNATQTMSRPLFKWHKSTDIGSGIEKYELCISGQTPIQILPSDTIKLLTLDLPNGPYTWFVKAYDKAGAFTSSNTHNLTISVPLPGLPATPAGAIESCVNSANTEFATTGATNADSYIWEITPAGAGTISGSGLTGTVDWNNTYTGTAQIKVKGHNNAGDGIVSAPFTVTVSPATIAGSVNGTGTICLGTSTGTLSLTGNIGNIIKWQKRVNSGSWADITSTAVTYSETPATIGNWEYRAGIQSGGCSLVFSTAATIIVGNTPATAGTISGPATVCQGQNSVIYTVPALANTISYIWTLPNGAAGTSAINSITVNYGISAVSGNLSVKGHNDCGEGATSILPVNVNTKPINPQITLNGRILHSTAISGNQWYNQNGIINGATNQEYTIIEDGIYSVIVTLSECSSDKSNTINFVSTGIESSEATNTIKVFPNPVTDELTIEKKGNAKNTKFEIINSLGEVIFKGNLIEKTVVQTSGWASGVYLLKLESGKTFEFKKIVKK